MKTSIFPWVQCGNSYYHDILWQRFGSLRVIERVIRIQRESRHTYWWKCLCDCGNIAYRDTEKLINRKGHAGNIVSCGCMGSNFRKPLCPVMRAIIIDHRINTSKTASAIGAYFGVTKNSIMGILDRAGMCDSKPETKPVREPITFPHRNQCVYPHDPKSRPGDPGFKWCCDPVKEESSYCRHHHGIVYISEEESRRRSRIAALDFTQQQLNGGRRTKPKSTSDSSEAVEAA